MLLLPLLLGTIVAAALVGGGVYCACQRHRRRRENWWAYKSPPEDTSPHDKAVAVSADELGARWLASGMTHEAATELLGGEGEGASARALAARIETWGARNARSVVWKDLSTRNGEWPRQRGQQHSIVFCGANGVGKTTTVAKVAHRLVRCNADLRMRMVAADTFRAGAIEQMRVHSLSLGVPMFERGYGVEPHKVVQSAYYVKGSGYLKDDLLLIDTAGRMHSDNASTSATMRQLAQVVNAARPLLIVLVVDGLVGHDVIAQIRDMNAVLAKECEGRAIDSLIVTKVDALGDKVGALVNLLHAARVPIDFIGTGQTYDDLVPFAPEALARLLLVKN